MQIDGTGLAAPGRIIRTGNIFPADRAFENLGSEMKRPKRQQRAEKKWNRNIERLFVGIAGGEK